MAKAVVAVLERVEAHLRDGVPGTASSDLGRFHRRFTSALIETREFSRSLKHWAKSARYGFEPAEDLKLAAKMFLELFCLRNMADRVLWNIRTIPSQHAPKHDGASQADT